MKKTERKIEMGTLFAGLLVAVLVGAAVCCLYRDKKSGKTCSGCSGNCGCGGCGNCEK